MIASEEGHRPSQLSEPARTELLQHQRDGQPCLVCLQAISLVAHSPHRPLSAAPRRAPDQPARNKCCGDKCCHRGAATAGGAARRRDCSTTAIR